MLSHRRLTVAGWAAVIVTAGSVLTGCATPAGGPGAPSAAASPVPSDTGPAVAHDLTVEEQLDQVVADIERDREPQDIPGYADAEIDVAARAVVVHWVGVPPAQVRQVVASAPAGITVTLQPAAYDVKAMITAVDKVVTTYHDYFSAASPNGDGSGITVEQSADLAGKGPSQEQLAALAGMPVTIEVGEGAEAVDG